MDNRNKILTGAAGLAVIGILLYQILSAHQDVYWISVFFLGILMLICESLGENLRTRGSSTYGIIVLVAAMLALNTPSAMLVALAGALSLQDLKIKKSPWAMAFNGVQYALGLAAASYVYHLLGGATRAFELVETLKSIPWLLLAMLVFWMVNTAFTALANHWEYGLAPRDFFMQDALKLLANQLIFALLGMALGIIYAQNAFNAVYLEVETGNIAPTIDLVNDAPQLYAGPFIVGTVAEAFRGFIASVFFLTVLGVAWYFSGRNLDILRTYDSATVRLVKYLEEREPYLNGHGERVAYYAQMMAHSLKMPLYDQQKLRYAALLHDLGKTAVPREILMQRGSLTGDEFERVTHHALVGGNWLEEVPYLAETAGAVLHHHEYYGGGGYLDGISSDTIPLSARILAVADSYDAMLNPRPWREAKGPEAAAAELQQNAGVQFDPELVRIFLAALEEYRISAAPLETMAAAEAEAPGWEEPVEEEPPPLRKGRMNKRRQKLMEERMKRRARQERAEAGEPGQWLEGESSGPRDSGEPPVPREPLPPESPPAGEEGGA